MRHVLANGVTSAPEDVTWTTALLQYADGPARVAMRTVDPIFQRLPGRLFLFTYEPGAARDLVRIALDADAPERAREVVAAARTLAERNPGVATLVGTALNTEGLVRRNPTLLRAAVDRLRDSPRRIVRASAKEDAAAADLSAGRADDAVTLLVEAMDEYADCGALAPARRVAARLREIGALSRAGAPAPATPGSDPTPTVTPPLTPAEGRVADRVAKGMTNREIADDLNLSRHTVDAHLRHIFQKLQVNSRAAAAAWITVNRNN
jgi:DNA-binding CsgD family transcriptional regulator